MPPPTIKRPTLRATAATGLHAEYSRQARRRAANRYGLGATPSNQPTKKSRTPLARAEKESSAARVGRSPQPTGSNHLTDDFSVAGHYLEQRIDNAIMAVQAPGSLQGRDTLVVAQVSCPEWLGQLEFRSCGCSGGTKVQTMSPGSTDGRCSAEKMASSPEGRATARLSPPLAFMRATKSA